MLHGLTCLDVVQYFIEPITGRRFRSKKEVRYYLETGEVRKKPKKNPDNVS